MADLAQTLTPDELDLLAVAGELAETDGRAPSLLEIARELDLPALDVAAMVDGLARAGHVADEAAHGDRRIRVVTPPLLAPVDERPMAVTTAGRSFVACFADAQQAVS
ncbi:MAG: hypothetical protein AB7N54_19830 [Alphaproteobacteria bacterium]